MRPLKRISLIALVTLLFPSCNLTSAAGLDSHGQPVKEVHGKLTSTLENSEVNVDYSQWDALLKKHVDKKGLVNYKGFQKDRKALDKYLQHLASKNPDEGWSVQELLAYYINTYNAYTVALILDNYPVKSIKDISGAWTKGIVPIDGKKLSLGGIENGILRKMNEPRIHFAINCASFSCPDLLNEAFTAAKIDEQLEKVTRAFINSDKNNITPTNPEISSIFNWYAKDYRVNGKKDVIGYINQFSNIKIESGATLRYKEYDWKLNEQQ